ncbi:SPOR domain-containing protein [Legionella septentrionalis]|uniref:SPOR domain-containing protein n=1 Tax=Legionella septentrionalis TaxID=2498109 RepID=A0A3S0VB43_9GAMM|nr:SPOR domain-containing protein [Legionella septentrionalis]RUQ89447.1 hypothetical protein EKM59_03340 [Legionella septentrionalis]
MSDGTIQFNADQLIDHDNLYKPASWLNKITFINHLVKGCNNILISVLGEQGSGKTTFAALLSENLDKEITSCLITASPLFNQGLFLSQLAVQLRHNGEVTLANIVGKSQAEKEHTLLIIDDAHYLSEAFISEILSVAKSQGEEAYFHVCLISNFSLVQVLNNLGQDSKDMIHSLELGHLTEQETKVYVLHRLLSQSSFLKDEYLKQFYQLTEGNILGINTQLAGFFHNGCMPKSKGVFFNKTAKRVTLVGSAIIVALGVAFFLQPQNQLPVETALALNAVQPAQETIANVKAIADPVLDSNIPRYDMASTVQYIQPAPLRRAELAFYSEEEDVNNNLVVMDKVVVIPQVAQAKAHQLLEQESTSVAQVVPMGGEIKANKLEIKKPVLKIADVKPKKPVMMQHKTPPGQFTIQLLASHSISALKDFAKIHRLADAKIRRAQRQGNAWYVLTIGEYKQKESANQAAYQLSKEIAKLKPWIRQLSDLQDIG